MPQRMQSFATGIGAASLLSGPVHWKAQTGVSQGNAPFLTGGKTIRALGLKFGVPVSLPAKGR